VTTPLPELLPFVDYIRIGSTPDEFRESIELSLSTPLAPASEAFLNDNSWDAKADLLWGQLQQLYASSVDSRMTTE
jgi:hypothetical protein